MQAKLKYTDDGFNEKQRFIEINTLEDLILLMKKENNIPLILTFYNDLLNIEVYNDYRE